MLAAAKQLRRPSGASARTDSDDSWSLIETPPTKKAVVTEVSFGAEGEEEESDDRVGDGAADL